MLNNVEQTRQGQAQPFRLVQEMQCAQGVLTLEAVLKRGVVLRHGGTR